MVENILVGAAVVTAFYFIIRVILKRLAGNGHVNPCSGCSGCSMGGQKDLHDCSTNVEPNGGRRELTCRTDAD